MEDGNKWKMENRKWKMGDGKCKMENGSYFFKYFNAKQVISSFCSTPSEKD